MPRISIKKTWRKMALVLCLPALFAFWFTTAPASMAVQRIAAGTGNGPIARCIICAADLYQAPMDWLCKSSSVTRFDNFMANWWCDVLDAPETTP